MRLPPPRKSLGQHFLRDANIIARIVDAVGDANGDGGHILEIGPGRGALTAALLPRADRLTAVELDRELAARLAKNFTDPKLTIICRDILKFNLRDCNRAHPTEKLRIVGNLPYQITTPLIFHLLAQLEHIVDMHFMVQREVARRLCAYAGDTNYGRLSAMTALALNIEFLFDVSPAAFNPRPKVHSTVLRLTPKQNPLRVRDSAQLEKIVRAAFQQRRKTLRNALAGLVAAHQFDRAGVDPNLRPQQLTPQHYIALADAVAAAP